ncbi:MAG: CSLREA domain-containing protein, partial [Chloroflexi bacterium]|nr:CSLREA domain-containing protein [Chloroflexota bacterium]
MAKQSRTGLVLLVSSVVLGALVAAALLVILPGSRGAAEQQSSDISLAQGWNLVSLPLVPADPAPSAVLASIAAKLNSAWAYDSSQPANPWLSYDPDVPASLNTLTAIDVKMGLWLNMKQAATLAVTGSQPGTTQIPIAQGWNFIGYPSGQALPVATVLAGLSYNSVWAYDPSLSPSPWQSNDPNVPPSLNTLQNFAPGHGYALNAPGPATLTIGTVETTLTQAASAGQTEIQVASVAGFAVGDHIRIDAGTADQEDNSIIGFGSMLLASPLQNAHKLGAPVIPLAFFTVNTTADHTPGPCNLTDCTLREAITAANASLNTSTSIPDTIDFDPTVFSSPKTILLDNVTLGPLPAIAEDLNILGPTAPTAPLTVDAAMTGRVFYINSGVMANISDLTMRGGNPGAKGGGIYNSGTLTLNKSTVSSNTSPVAFSGGGIYNGGTLTVNDSTVSGNSGGGIYNGGTLTLN